MAVFSICGENTALWQWDLDRRIAVDHPSCRQVHFSSENGENALVCEVYGENGVSFADIPNVLLQTDHPLKVYAFVTDREGKRTVISETFVVEARPKPQDYIYTEMETWSVEKAVSDALQVAKENGDFRGEPGPKGDPGVVKFLVVTVLPESDAENAIYLLPNEEGAGENLFDEYIFVDGKWEKIGSASVAVNLDEYVKKMPDATTVEKAKVYSNKYNNSTGDNTVVVDGYYQAGKFTIPVRSSEGGIYIPDKACADCGGIPAGEVAVNRKYVDGRITANEDGTLTVLLADGSRYKVNATKEET